MRRLGRVTALILGAAILTAGCRKEPLRPDAIAPGRVTTVRTQSVRTQTERRIEHLYPAETRAGVPFNIQPNGNSAISVVGAGLLRTDAIYWNGMRLPTVFGSPANLTAEVLPDQLRKPGDVNIEVRSDSVPEAATLTARFRITGQEDARSMTPRSPGH